MPQRIKEVDAYIAKAQPFAQPILKKIRDLFHQASPEIEEEMKWSAPHFVCAGIVGGMAGFKQHVSFGFWKASLMSDPQGLLKSVGDTSMGSMKVTSLDDLPPEKVMLAYIREAVDLNKSGVKLCKPGKAPKPEAKVPDDLAAALKKNKPAAKAFAAFSPSHRREYIEWITEAKQDATRQKRLATTIEWLTEGKSRHWKYQNC
jgi:uncharacterized protein YdeI (YjbR/CyaY-like superfamily)